MVDVPGCAVKGKARILRFDTAGIVSYYAVRLLEGKAAHSPERRREMALTADSTIADVMKSRPDAKEIIARHAGQPIDEGMLAMAMSMSLRQVAGFVGWGPDKIEALLKDLNEGQ